LLCFLGWEKAEAEAVTLKLQLDAALQQKLATEDRVAHLDGALKECMKQLRHVREEQEQLIHDTLVKKTREYDKLRVEMETKLAEASQILSQTRTELLESRAEGKALSHALQVYNEETNVDVYASAKVIHFSQQSYLILLLLNHCLCTGTLKEPCRTWRIQRTSGSGYQDFTGQGSECQNSSHTQ
jgi:hypothetical protein